MSVISVFQRNLLLNSPVRQLIVLESQEFEKKTSKSSASERKRKETVDCQKPANRNHAKIRNHRRTIARDLTDSTLFIPLYL